MLDANKIRLSVTPSAEGDKATGGPSNGFRIDFSTLKFSLADGNVARYDGGSISHKGGFRLTSGTKSIDADQFIIAPSDKMADGLQLTVTTGKQAYPAMDLVHGGAFYQIKEKQLRIGTLDLVLTLQAAQELGRPELSGLIIGSMKIFGEADPIDGGGDVEPPGSGGGNPRTPGSVDLALSDMGTLSWIGRTGTYPNGNNALSMYTTSCNRGTINIPWNQPMAVTHPAIAMQLYRVLNGRFEEVGFSWMKHGFFATNQNQCGTCQNPGTGALLGVSCSDTYGVGNNDDQFYLGGRDEMNGFTGVWTCTGSWFSNFVNDCTRRNTGSGLSVTDHRLQALDADLGITGALYYYEARYVNANDSNTYNNLASRQATFTWNGSSWSINTVDSAETVGPAINRWGEMRSTAQPQTDGDVIVAVQTTNLGGGMWHYEYAVYNHTSDRQIRSFSVPMPDGMVVQNIGFHDIDQDGTNNWAGVYASNSVTWSTGVFGSSTANPLKFSSVFNFRFDSNVPPVGNSATLGEFKPGTGSTLTAASKGPVMLGADDSVQIVNGAQVGGNLNSLAHSDDDRLRIAATDTGARSGTGLVVTATAPSATVNSLVIGVESSDSVAPSIGGNQLIQLWNWTTSAWEQVDSRAVTLTDSLALVTVSSNASRFVNASTHQVQARILHVVNIGANYSRLQYAFDQIGFQFN